MLNNSHTKRLGAEQLFVMRLLELSSSRAAAVRRRAADAEREVVTAATASQPPEGSSEKETALCQASPSSSCVKHDRRASVEGSENAADLGEESSTVVTRMLPFTDENMTGSSNTANSPTNLETLTAAVVLPASETKPSSSRANSAEAVATPEAEEEQTAERAAPQESVSLSLPLSPPSSFSPSRRIREMKSAQPMRRPRGGTDDAARSSPFHGSNAAAGAGAGVGRKTRVEAAKAAHQREAVRRTLMALGLPVSSNSTSTSPSQLQRGLVSSTSPANEEAEEEEKTSLQVDDAVRTASSSSEEEREAPTSTPLPEKKVEVTIDATRGTSATSTLNPALKPEGTPNTNAVAAKAASEAAPLPEATRPLSPNVAESFSLFLQQLFPSTAPAEGSTDANPLPVPENTNGIAASAFISTIAEESESGADASVDDGALSSRTSSMIKAQCAVPPSSLPLGPQPALSLVPLPLPPPPYAGAAISPSNVGAGTFTTAQDLVAHVRLSLPWTVATSQRRCQMPVDCGRENPLPPSPSLGAIGDPSPPSSRPLSAISVDRVRQVSAAETTPAATAPAGSTTTTVPTFASGEATLVSDRVDAVLPTWSYVTSHVGDAAPLTLPFSLLGPFTKREPSTPQRAGLSRTRRSHNSSLASSVTNAVAETSLLSPHEEGIPAITAESLPGRVRVDRQCCVYPHDLAEACALARSRRQRQRGVTGEAGGEGGRIRGSSMHLVRLELHVDVQQTFPTIRTVSAEERQRQQQHFLDAFADTGVLPTTVLRGVLNDAALRLFSSVDDELLHEIAHEEAREAKEAAKERDKVTEDQGLSDSDNEAPRAIPLSLHVHTVQGELISSARVAFPPSLALPLPAIPLAHSATASTVSGDTGSSPTTSGSQPPTVPTQVVLTMLVRVCGGPTSKSGEDTVVEAPTESARDTVRPTVSEAFASPLAAAVLQHLLPLSFAMSRFTTRLSVSTALDEEALCNDGGMAADTDAEEKKGEARVDGGADAETCEATGRDLPWAWWEVPLTAVRALCDLPEPEPVSATARIVPTPPLSTSPYTRAGLQKPDSVGGSVESMNSSLTSHGTRSRTRRSKRKRGGSASVTTIPLAVTVEGAAAADKSGAPQPRNATEEEKAEPEPNTAHEVEETGKEPVSEPLLHSDAKATEEAVHDTVQNDDSAGVSESLVRYWDVAKETQELTTLMEALQRRLGFLCDGACQLKSFTQAEAGMSRGDSSVQVAPRYTQEVRSSERAVAALAAVQLAYAAFPELMEEQTRQTSVEQATGAPQEPDLKASPTTEAVITTWFARCAAHLKEEVCSPLEQLEAFISEYTSSAVTTPVITATGSSGLVEPSASAVAEDAYTTAVVTAAAPRRVVGAQVVVKETRRQRRAAAAAARLAGMPATKGEKQTSPAVQQQSSAGSVKGGAWADAQEVPLTPVLACLLPSLSIARAMVCLCDEMAGTTTRSCKVAHHEREHATEKPMHPGSSPHSHTPLVCSCSAACGAHTALYRSFSSSSTLSLRLTGTPSIVQSLQERVSLLQEVLQRVEMWLATQQRRWSTLEAPLATVKAIMNEGERVAAAEVQDRLTLEASASTELAAREVYAKKREAASRAVSAAFSEKKNKTGKEDAPLDSSDEPSPALATDLHAKRIFLHSSVSSRSVSGDAAAVAFPPETPRKEREKESEGNRANETEPRLCTTTTTAAAAATVGDGAIKEGTGVSAGSTTVPAISANDLRARGDAPPGKAREGHSGWARQNPAAVALPAAAFLSSVSPPAEHASDVEPGHEAEEEEGTSEHKSSPSTHRALRVSKSDKSVPSSSMLSASETTSRASSVCRANLSRSATAASSFSSLSHQVPLRSGNRGGKKGHASKASRRHKEQQQQQQQQQQSPHHHRLSSSRIFTAETSPLRPAAVPATAAGAASDEGLPSPISSSRAAASSGAIAPVCQTPVNLFRLFVQRHVDVAVLRQATPFMVLGVILFTLCLLL